MRLQSNKLSDRKTGPVLEYLSSDVLVGAGQATWSPSVGIGSMTRDTTNWINDAATPQYAGYAAGGVMLANNNVIPNMQDLQGCIMWNCAEFAGAQNYMGLGDTSTAGEIKMKRALTKITDADGNTLTTDALTAAANGLVATVYNPVTEALEMHQYTDAGVFVEKITAYTKVGEFDFASGIKFSEQFTIQSLVTDITGYNICSMGLVYFDTMPTDAEISAGLLSMSSDPQSGCYDAWR